MADFQSSLGAFESEGIRIVAGSVDPVEKAEETVQKVRITFPIAYGLDADEMSKKTGAYYDHGKKFLHATGFIIRPDKTVAVACYSTGPIGRFTAMDVLNLIRFYKSRR